MNTFLPLFPLCLAALFFGAAPAFAADDHGHDHGNSPAPAGPALPRFAAASEAFELVGELDGKRITLYLDRAPDNAPVTAARIELEIGGARLVAVRRGNDAFEVVLASQPTPGVLPITATVAVGTEVDLLAGELDIPGAATAADTPRPHAWAAPTGWIAGAAVGLAALVVIGRRAVAARRRPPLRTSGAA